MSDIASLVRDLIDAGTPPDIAAAVVAQAYQAGVDATNSTRIPPESTLEKRRAWDREYRRRKKEFHPNSTRIPPDPPESDNSALSIKKESKIKKDRQRASRIPPDWSPSSEDRAFAEAQGLPATEIEREGEKFRDFWNGKPGAAGVKLDWPATWRNWIRRVCEQRGFTPPMPTKPADSPEARGWRPGLPTDEELRAKYAERRKAEKPTGAEPNVLAEGPRVRDENGNGLVRDKTGDGRVRQLGELFSEVQLEAVGHEATRTSEDRDFPSAGAMAGMV